MWESNTLIIKDKIIKLEDVRNLANRIFQEKNPLGQIYTDKISFRVKCEDLSHYESRELDIFTENPIIRLKKVNEVTLTYEDANSDKKIYVKIQTGDSSADNYIEVSGKNSNWVNGLSKNLNDIIESFAPQYMKIRKYTPAIQLLTLFSVGFLALTIFRNTISDSVWQSLNGSYSYMQAPPEMFVNSVPPTYTFVEYILASIFFIVFDFIFGYFFAFPFVSKLPEKVNKVWPNVEIQIGPEHKMYEKNKRRVIRNILLLFVIPFLTSAIFEVGMRLFSK